MDINDAIAVIETTSTQQQRAIDEAQEAHLQNFRDELAQVKEENQRIQKFVTEAGVERQILFEKVCCTQILIQSTSGHWRQIYILRVCAASTLMSI